MGRFGPKILILFFVSLFVGNSLGYAMPPFFGPSNSIDVHKWVKRNFAKGQVPPFSFIYGGESSGTFIKKWRYEKRRLETIESNIEKSVFTYTDEKSGLVVKCRVTVYNDFPAVEWVLKFLNTSGEKTPVIEKAAAIDYSFASKKKGDFVLHHAKGSNAALDDFMPQTNNLTVGSPVYMTPQGGRSSDRTAFPFFNIETPDNAGIMVAIGWTGKWYAEVKKKNQDDVNLKAGMENLSLYLLPKEEIRTPKNLSFVLEGKRPYGGSQ